MNTEAKKMIQDLLEPTLLYQLKTKRHSAPNLRSHVGGHPYTEKNDRLPICKQCHHGMTFVFQLHIPDEKKRTMFSFYYCYRCHPTKGNKGFKMNIHTNPSIEKMVFRKNWESVLPYAEFEFEPNWSLPEWDALPFINKNTQQLLTKHLQEKAEMAYEDMAEEFLQEETFEAFSFFGGYPKFLAFPHFPVCSHCKETMDLFIQLDSEEEKKMVWNEYGCLYIFRCKQESNQFYIMIQ